MKDLLLFQDDRMLRPDWAETTRRSLRVLLVRQFKQGSFKVVSNRTLDRPSIGYCGLKAGDMILKRRGASDPDVRFV